MGADLSMWTDGRTGMTKLIVAFRNLASAPKNGIIVRIALLVKHFISQLMHNIQGVAGGKVNILGGHSIGNSKQTCLYEHVSYSERFPR